MFYPVFCIFLGIFNLSFSLWDPSHLTLNQLDLFPPKEWSCVLSSPNFLTVWAASMDYVSSLRFRSKCPAIWLLLSPNSEVPVSQFTVNLLPAKHKGLFSDFMSFVFSATLELLKSLILSFLIRVILYMTMSFLLNVWMLFGFSYVFLDSCQLDVSSWRLGAV